MLSLAPLQSADIADIAAAFAALGWDKPAAQYARYLREQDDGARTVRIARWNGVFAGYVTVAWRPDYEPFAKDGIPETQDFNVLPDFRRRRIGSALMDEAERLIATRYNVAGIGAGLHHD